MWLKLFLTKLFLNKTMSLASQVRFVLIWFGKLSYYIYNVLREMKLRESENRKWSFVLIISQLNKGY